jgi:sortase A
MTDIFVKINIMRKVMIILSDILLTLAIIIGLYIVYQVFWTGVEANTAQQEIAEKMSLPNPPVKIAKKHYDNIPVVKEPGNAEPFGKVYIPKFPKNYWRALLEGVGTKDVLDWGAYGHYPNTAMPGQIGNFAVAAHRSGYGGPLDMIDVLEAGDAIIIRTYDYWFVYDVTKHYITLPNDGKMLLPVPEHPGATPTERLLTFTTCHPLIGNSHRYILHGKFDYWAKVKEGIPQELYDAGFTEVEYL